MQTKEPRQRTSREVELTVLDRSRRRCALCFHLHNDLREKHGQLAHLDNDRANSIEDNLAFLCLEHHSLFDSTTSQHKGYTIDEAKAARARLYEAIEQGLHFSSVPSLAMASPSNEADRQTLDQILTVLPSGGSINFIRGFHFGGGYRLGSLKDLREFQYGCAGPEHEFLDPALETLRAQLREAIVRFHDLLAANSHQLGTGPDPILKIPQRHEMKDPAKWDEIVGNINDAADAVVTAYDTLIRECRRKLT